MPSRNPIICVNQTMMSLLLASSVRRPSLLRSRCISTASMAVSSSSSSPSPNVEHREIGAQQRLFTFRSCCAGQAIMLPHGQRIFNRLLRLLRDGYSRTGYDEVSTPLIHTNSLWQTSGHYEHYREDMFTVGNSQGSQVFGEAEESLSGLGLKPMNCPAHCLIYEHEPRSYRDLPLRLAEFSPLHRNEASGGLTGLTRLRRFHQDDAHIFCRPDQVLDEIKACLKSIKDIYTTFGFSYSLKLSTRPEHSMGSQQAWNNAEQALREALKESGLEWSLNAGDGAFYGPKIDVSVTDAMNRSHQCATIQLDFQLPERFDLGYTCRDGAKVRPVLIHRAILGSLERMMAILIEHTGGRWPLWLSPRQVFVCPVSSKFSDDAHSIAERLRREGGFFVDVDDADQKLGKRLRDAQMLQYNFMVVIGENERDGSLKVKSRDGTLIPFESVEEFTKYLKQLEHDKL